MKRLNTLKIKTERKFMKYCTECGKKTKEGAKFCDGCGHNLSNNPDKQKNVNSIRKVEVTSSSKRLINFLLDNIIGAVGSIFILAFIFGLLGLTTGYEDDSFWTLWGGVAIFLYFFLCEFFWGKTLGKVFTRTRVVMESGEKPTIGAIFIRTLVRFIPLEIFSFSGSYPVGWHDSVSKTLVIDD
jgi:uncharacterized RDD family membrane protein YckC